MFRILRCDVKIREDSEDVVAARQIRKRKDIVKM